MQLKLHLTLKLRRTGIQSRVPSDLEVPLTYKRSRPWVTAHELLKTVLGKLSWFPFLMHMHQPKAAGFNIRTGHHT